MSKQANETGVANEIQFKDAEVKAVIKNGADTKVMIESVVNATNLINKSVNERVDAAKKTLEERNAQTLELAHARQEKEIRKEFQKELDEKDKKIKALEAEVKQAAEEHEEELKETDEAHEVKVKTLEDKIADLKEQINSKYNKTTFSDLVWMLKRANGTDVLKGWRNSTIRTKVAEVAAFLASNEDDIIKAL